MGHCLRQYGPSLLGRSAVLATCLLKMAYIPLLIYSLWEAVPLTVYGKHCALGLGYERVYLGSHMRAMFSFSGDSAISAPQQDKIYLRVISTLIKQDKSYLI